MVTIEESRLEEYKELRAESLDVIHAMRQLETYTVSSVMVFYSWLSINSAAVPPGSLPWWFPFPYVLLAFMRNRAFLSQLRTLNTYLEAFEDSFVINGEKPLAWYLYLKKGHRPRLFNFYDYSLWPLFLGLTIVLPLLADKLISVSS
ncbi:MAG: hypothetical protein F6J87_15530 [Spirulina sp. SIO3F2]|nr:hypothetical protein [Spirulina sp. SIO3F2]